MGSLADPPAPRVRAKRVREVVAEVLGTGPLDDQAGSIRLDDIHADDGDRQMIALGVEELFSIEVSEEEANGWSTIAEICETVERLVAERGR